MRKNIRLADGPLSQVNLDVGTVRIRQSGGEGQEPTTSSWSDTTARGF
ncbi:hypothetical protein [Streptomyces cremeus]|uniref:Uncharacterized protein n=1 Tax=Streptomyces cremeus TaxID=66881 RepID=A0ABV5PE85_STRCM